MHGQQFTCFLDAVQQPCREITVFEMTTHFCSQEFPEFFPALFMHRSIANDSKLARAWGDKDKHPVFLAGFAHAKSLVLFLCRCHRFIDSLVADEDADFTRSRIFGALDGGNNFIVLQLVKKFLRFHITNFLRHRRHRNCPRHWKILLRLHHHLTSLRLPNYLSHRCCNTSLAAVIQTGGIK